MRVILFSLGTRGDIEPFLAIAQLLKEKKWKVICAFPEQFKDVVEDADISFNGLSKKFLELIEGEQGQLLMGGKGSPLKKIKALFWMIKESKEVQKIVIDQQRDLIHSQKPDLVIYNGKCSFPMIWGMANPGKAIMVSAIPCFIHYVKDHATIGMNFNLGPFINRLTYKLSNFGLFTNLYKTTKKYHKDFDEIKFSAGKIKKHFINKEKLLYTISSSLFPRPDYWPSKALVVGYHERNKLWDWRPDSGLLEFIGNYRKILFVTFGSMTNPEPLEKTKIILQALDNLKIPAIINIASGGLDIPENVPDHVLFLRNVPYDWIFPKMYAVIHHGGSGTTHMAIKYGCASMIVPHIIDQFYWNDLVSELGAGPKGISIKKLKSRKLERKVSDLFNNPIYRRNAELLGDKMRRENFREELYNLLEN
jgi:UDP:flavonoid glycosyltransferase YjiC (YdhE family)